MPSKQRSTSNTNLSMSSQRWPIILLMVLLVGLTVAVSLFRLTCPGISLQIDGVFLSGPLFGILGMLIAFYRTQNRIGWLCLLIGGVWLLNFVAGTVTDCGLIAGMSLPGVALAAWYQYTLQPSFVLLPLFVFLPMVFPNGRFLSSRWRYATLILLVMVLIAEIFIALGADLLEENNYGIAFSVENPFSILPPDWASVAGFIQNFLFVGAALLGIVALVVRFRQARGDERQQLKWFAYFLSTAVAGQLIIVELGVVFLVRVIGLDISDSGMFYKFYLAVVNIVFLGFPVTIGIAVFKYRLYAIDIIIRKTLQYSIISAVLAIVYFGVISLIQGAVTAVTNTNSPLAIVLSTLLIAALFNPLRRRVQQFIDRRFYRQKYDAQQVLAQFAQTARDEVEMEVLQTELLRVVQETMQPETVSIWLKREQR